MRPCHSPAKPPTNSTRSSANSFLAASLYRKLHPLHAVRGGRGSGVLIGYVRGVRGGSRKRVFDRRGVDRMLECVLIHVLVGMLTSLS